MQPETKRETVTLLARAVAHLYAIAGALASRRKWNADERAVELVRVLEMLTRAYERLAPRPDCAASVFEQYMVVRDVQASARDDVQATMDLARAGLVLNTWCTAASMLVSAQATDGPLTIGGLVQTVGSLRPDPGYQAAVAEQLTTVAYDNSAAHQLGNCYFQAFEAYSLLEIHRLLAMGDTSRAADLLDNASRGARTAARFLDREPLDQAKADSDTQAHDRDHALADDTQARAAAHAHDGAQADASDTAQANCDTGRADDSDGALALADDRDHAPALAHCDTGRADDSAAALAEATDHAQALPDCDATLAEAIDHAPALPYHHETEPGAPEPPDALLAEATAPAALAQPTHWARAGPPVLARMNPEAPSTEGHEHTRHKRPHG